MQILGKCSLLESQIMDRVRKGATQVELNLSRELMMEDGSIKAYSSLEGGGELDDESRLVTPEVEGGFGVNKTY